MNSVATVQSHTPIGADNLIGAEIVSFGEPGQGNFNNFFLIYNYAQLCYLHTFCNSSFFSVINIVVNECSHK